MNTIHQYLAQDHKRCDDLFARAEEEVGHGDWDAGILAFEEFQRAMLHHFRMEEDVVFPAFEERTGMTGGPTMIMRGEHQQLRGLLAAMNEALVARKKKDFLGQAETLLLMMQQHNLKEEQVLYPLADQALASELDKIMDRMAAIHE